MENKCEKCAYGGDACAWRRKECLENNYKLYTPKRCETCGDPEDSCFTKGPACKRWTPIEKEPAPVKSWGERLDELWTGYTIQNLERTLHFREADIQTFIRAELAHVHEQYRPLVSAATKAQQVLHIAMAVELAEELKSALDKLGKGE